MQDFEKEPAILEGQGYNQFGTNKKQLSQNTRNGVSELHFSQSFPRRVLRLPEKVQNMTGDRFNESDIGLDETMLIDSQNREDNL